MSREVTFTQMFACERKATEVLCWDLSQPGIIVVFTLQMINLWMFQTE